MKNYLVIFYAKPLTKAPQQGFFVEAMDKREARYKAEEQMVLLLYRTKSHLTLDDYKISISGERK